MRSLSFLFCGLLSSSVVLADKPDTSTCPNEFHSLAIHSEAKLCQIFDSTTPSSMVYHVKEIPSDAIAFFLENQTLSLSSSENKRTLIMNSTKTHRIIISPDGNGSQVDILITNASS